MSSHEDAQQALVNHEDTAMHQVPAATDSAPKARKTQVARAATGATDEVEKEHSPCALKKQAVRTAPNLVEEPAYRLMSAARKCGHVEQFGAKKQAEKKHAPSTGPAGAGDHAAVALSAQVLLTKKRGTAQPFEVALLPDALLTMKTVGAISGLSQATLYRKAATDPTFPKMLRIGRRCTRVRAGALTTWLSALGEA